MWISQVDMSSGLTREEATHKVAVYCSECFHQKVCKYTDAVRALEERIRQCGAEAECYDPFVVHCSERSSIAMGNPAPLFWKIDEDTS